MTLFMGLLSTNGGDLMSELCNLILSGYEVSLTPLRDDFSFGGGERQLTGTVSSRRAYKGEGFLGFGCGVVSGAGSGCARGYGYGYGLARGKGNRVENLAAGHEVGSGVDFADVYVDRGYRWETPNV